MSNLLQYAPASEPTLACGMPVGDLIVRVRETLAGIERYLRGTATFDRPDRLWPADHRVFTTNPLSLAYGACGTAVFLHERGALRDEFGDRVRKWLLAHPLDVERIPPGLHVGLAGIALALERLGLAERAEQAMRLACDSPLLEAEADLLYGAAGWGRVSLFFHQRTGDPHFLEMARRAGEHLRATAQRDEEGRLFWRSGLDGRIHIGYGQGASGIALFLLELGMRIGDAATVAFAREALDGDLAREAEDPNGPAWPDWVGSTTMMPYLHHGAAGIASVALRFHRRLGDPRYLAAARAAADSVDMKWSLQPSLMYGMSGLGELMLDMHQATGEARYLATAYELAETILWYRLERNEGFAFPGELLTRITTDYATGSAGIGMYLHRLLTGGRHWLVLDL